MRFFGASLVFIAELGMLAGFAVAGWHAADGILAWVLAVVLPAAAALMWGMFLAPRARRPLKPKLVATIVRLDMLLIGALLAWLAGARELGVITAALALVGTLLAGDVALGGGLGKDPNGPPGQH